MTKRGGNPRTEPIRVFGEGLQPSLTRARLLAQRNLPVLIVGPTGSGKELVARAYAQAWCEQQDVDPDDRSAILNCTGFTDELLRSELFGHIKGAFTGAIRNHRGLIGSHDLICLDEIGDAGEQVQVQLLRVVDSGEYLPVGGQRVQRGNARFIASTSRIEGVRAELIHRFHLVDVPQLARRGEDIVAIVSACAANKGIERVTQRFIAWAARYTWPGNVRELLRHVEEAAITGVLDIVFFVSPLDADAWWRSMQRMPEADRADTSSVPIADFATLFRGIYSSENMHWMITQAEQDSELLKKDYLRDIERSLREIAAVAKYSRLTNSGSTIGRRPREEGAANTFIKRAGPSEPTAIEAEKRRLERVLSEAGTVTALAEREGLTESGMRYRLQQFGIKASQVIPVRTRTRKSAATRSE